MKNSKQKVAIKVDKQENQLSINFMKFRDLRQALKILKTNFNVSSSWKNWFSFYLLFFDDYFKAYKIEEADFFVQPDGFTWMEGLALATKKSNEATFDKVVATLEEKYEVK